MLLKRGMGNGEWGMGIGEWGIGNSGRRGYQKNELESAQYVKETRIARGKRKMEGKNIEFLSVSFSRVFEIIEFLFIKINQNY